jgi:phosphatidylserine decarboxylase
MMRLAPEGRTFIVVAWAAVALLALANAWIPLVLLLPMAIWVVMFFRDPVRLGPTDPLAIVAPADGRIVSIIAIDEPTFIQGSSTRVAIFMNVFNVHVNRYPATGRVAFRSYQRGRFVHAASEKASSDNEQSNIGVEVSEGRGRVLIRQIAGLVARRIVTDHYEGREVARGDRLGLIRFGSRVDLFLPPQVSLQAAVGDRTIAGETIIAMWAP